MRKTKEEAEKTKRIIVENALELFLKQGFSKTKLDEIASAANVTRGAIYWHFKDKLDIVNELIETEHQNLNNLLSEMFMEEIDPLEKIEKIFNKIVLNFYENKLFRKFIELTWFKVEYTELAQIRTSKEELTELFIKNLTKTIIDGQKIGKIKIELNAADTAFIITHIIDGMYRMYFIIPAHFSKIDEVQNQFQSYLNLIKT